METGGARALLAVLAAMLLAAVGCSPPSDSGDLPAYEVQGPAGWRDGPPARREILRRDIESGSDVLELEPGMVKLREYWLGKAGGVPAEIDLQTEAVGEGVDVDLYDEISRDTMEDASVGLSFGPTTDFEPFDGEESTVVDLRGPGYISRIASVVRDGLAFNLSFNAPTRIVNQYGDAMLREVIESWRWEDD